ncbi:MAG TPA: type II secretion system F family protein [Candidatus Limnocylindrales bacterium]|nr:type II secretion system F family protein [Candidatus Limnocylindrales bacterium]
MPEFTYKIKIAGRKIKKTIEAPNKEAAIRLIKNKTGADVNSVKPKSKPIEIPFLSSMMKPKIKTKDVVIFTRQFATMIDAGLPLVQCLEILGNQQENPTFAEVIKKLRVDVEEGSTFADALRKHPKVFDNLFTNLVEAGEAGGILDTILNRLAGYLEKAQALRAKIKSAMIYPITVITVAIVVVVFLLIFVIPTFASLFTGLGAPLPGPTLFVMALSQFLVRFGPFLAVGLVVAGYLFKKYYATENGRRTVDAFILKLPIFGDLVTKASVARFTRTLGTLISSGVPILDGLEITARTAGNAIIELAVMETRNSIKEGKTIAEPLELTEVFPPMVVQMVSVGEQSGALDSMLAKIADFYEEEVDRAVENLTSLLEPLMIVFLGITVGGIVISMYLPIFSLIKHIG